MNNVRKSVVQAQRRYFRPQGIAIPDEHMPPLEGTQQFDDEVNDYYSLKLNQSFWTKQLHARFMSEDTREAVRKRTHGKQARFDSIKLFTVHESEQQGDVTKKAATLLTKRFNEPAPPKAIFKQGDRILPASGPMKHQPATVLGYRDSLLWLQYDVHDHPLPLHPSAFVKGWSLLSRVDITGDLPDVSDAHVTLTAGAPVAMRKSKASADDEDLKEAAAAQMEQVTETSKAENEAVKVEETTKEEAKIEEAQPKAEELKSEEPKAEETEPKAEESKGEEPKVEVEPRVEEPKIEPKVEETEPKAEEPKIEESKAEEPKGEEPKSEEPKVDELITEVQEAKEPKVEEEVKGLKTEAPKPESEAEESKAEEPKTEGSEAEETKAEEPTTEQAKVGEEPNVGETKDQSLESRTSDMPKAEAGSEEAAATKTEEPPTADQPKDSEADTKDK
eukprot:TRINITY_DN13797_c0_g2_i2.p1 TRINITY_DN13797_c0_g2~~TRINITY_DN13797_c0_g2_i2.p1  ORF type:complete len:447 (+),score=146.41 TRINITY_DN13797_c0_g2_i2:47-1387(+)